MATLLPAALSKNDRKARIIIWIFSIAIFSVVVLTSRVHLAVNLGFNVHLFAKANAIINSVVSVLLLLALWAVKQKKFTLHRNAMLTAMVLSLIFLLSYTCHHLFAGETKYGGDGAMRYLYFFILATHIPLAAIIMPFVLFTAYRALIAEYSTHMRLARITWPIWFYVSVTGVLVYWFISPYYV